MRFLPFLAFPVVALSLTACSATSATPVPVNTSSAETPAFATDEEALAAAQAAYAEYLQVSDQIAREGGANPERLKKLISPELYSTEVSTLSLFQKEGIVMTGNSTFDSVHVQSNSKDLVTYLCLDTSQATLIDRYGNLKSVSQTRFPMEVTFRLVEGKLILEDSQAWSGNDFC